MKKNLIIVTVIIVLIALFGVVAFTVTRDGESNDEVTTTTTTEAPTTTVAPETTTPVETTTTETTTEAPTTTVKPEITTTEAPTTTAQPETTTEAVKPLESWQSNAIAPSNTTELRKTNNEEENAMFQTLVSKYDLPKGVYRYVDEMAWDLEDYNSTRYGYEPYAALDEYGGAFLFDLSGNVIWELSVMSNGFTNFGMLRDVPSEISADGTKFKCAYASRNTDVWFDVPTLETDMEAWWDNYNKYAYDVNDTELFESYGVKVGEYMMMTAMSDRDKVIAYTYRVSEIEGESFNTETEMLAKYPDAVFSGWKFDNSTN